MSHEESVTQTPCIPTTLRALPKGHGTEGSKFLHAFASQRIMVHSLTCNSSSPQIWSQVSYLWTHRQVRKKLTGKREVSQLCQVTCTSCHKPSILPKLQIHHQRMFCCIQWRSGESAVLSSFIAAVKTPSQRKAGLKCDFKAAWLWLCISAYQRWDIFSYYNSSFWKWNLGIMEDEVLKNWAVE